MNLKKYWTPALLAAAGLAALVGSIAVAATDTPAGGQAEMQLPPGWTAEDMQAMMEAATPGKMQALLTQDAGTWRCKSTYWASADSEPVMSDGTSTVTPLMDGRYIQIEMSGEMPGLGPYNGLGIYGYDNVSKQFVSSWIDNHGTGISNGIGKLSDDGKTLTWNFTANCPITKRLMTLREVDTITGPNTKRLEMFGTSPKGGPEFKMMSIEMTRE